MRTGCSQQAIVKPFHILPYMVKQQPLDWATLHRKFYTSTRFLKIYCQSRLVLAYTLYELRNLYPCFRIKIYFVWIVIFQSCRPNVIYQVSLPHINWPLLHNIGNKQANTLYIPETQEYNWLNYTHTRIQKELKTINSNYDDFHVVQKWRWGENW